MKYTKIQYLNKFYKFCKSNGINIANLDYYNLDFSQPTTESSFKNRSNEIKSKFNHVFNVPNEQKKYFDNNYKEMIFITKN
jgi:hypothetical protein